MYCSLIATVAKHITALVIILGFAFMLLAGTFCLCALYMSESDWLSVNIIIFFCIHLYCMLYLNVHICYLLYIVFHLSVLVKYIIVHAHFLCFSMKTKCTDNKLG